MNLPTLKLRDLEKMAIDEALKQSGGSVAKAARVLGIGRATLYRRLSARQSQPKPADPRQLNMYQEVDVMLDTCRHGRRTGAVVLVLAMGLGPELIAVAAGDVSNGGVGAGGVSAGEHSGALQTSWLGT